MFIDWPLAIMALSSAIIGGEAADSAGINDDDDDDDDDDASARLKRRVGDEVLRGAAGTAGTAPRGVGDGGMADTRGVAGRDMGAPAAGGVMLEVSRAAEVGVRRGPSGDQRRGTGALLPSGYRPRDVQGSPRGGAGSSSTASEWSDGDGQPVARSQRVISVSVELVETDASDHQPVVVTNDVGASSWSTSSATEPAQPESKT